MDAPQFVTPLPPTKPCTTQDALALEVTVSPPLDDVTFRWEKGAVLLVELTGEAGQHFDKAEPTVDDSGTYTVKAWRTAGVDKSDEVLGGECQVTVTEAEAPNPNPNPTQPPGEWDAEFAGQVLKYAAGAAAAMLLVIIAVAFLKASIAWTVALGMLAIAAVLAAGGIAVALIDLRGRARATAVVTNDARGLGQETLKAAGDILKAWGALGLASAMLALAAIAMISATTLGWRSLPDPTPATASPGASASASPSASASSTAPAPAASVTP